MDNITFYRRADDVALRQKKNQINRRNGNGNGNGNGYGYGYGNGNEKSEDRVISGRCYKPLCLLGLAQSQRRNLRAANFY